MHRSFTVRPVGADLTTRFNAFAVLIGAMLAVVFLSGGIRAQERVLRVSVFDLQDKPIENQLVKPQLKPQVKPQLKL